MKRVGITLVVAMSVCSPVFAGPADYVYTPAVEYGEREIDFKFGTAEEQDSTRENEWNTAVLFGVSDAAPDYTFRMQVEYEF